MKYHNKKIEINGIVFDSKKEAMRYQDLSLMLQTGTIKCLERQVKYVLIPAQYEPGTEYYKSGKHKGELKRGRLLERECAYVADFTYYNTQTNQTVVEDTKGFRTKEYIIKRKLMLERYGIQIHEV